MSSLADQMLAAGAIPNLDAFHSENIKILSGPGNGKVFRGRMEVQPDITLNGEVADDPRASRVMYVTDGTGPENFVSQCKVQTESGKIWTVVYDPQDDYLENAYTVKQWVQGTDS